MSGMTKVDRVASVAEARAIEAAGADLICVCLAPDLRFADGRIVTADVAASIRRGLGRAECVVAFEIGEDADRGLRTAKGVDVRLVQPVTGTIPPAEVREAFGREGIGIVYPGIEVNHDDDPSWILSRFDGVPELDRTYYQIDLLPEYPDSWEVLRDESPDYADELQIGDIDALGHQRPLLITLDWSPGNVMEIMDMLPGVAGIALVLADAPVRDDVHHADLPTVLSVLGALHP